MLKLDNISLIINLPEWQNADFETINRSTIVLKAVGRSAGVTSDKFKKAIQFFLRLANDGRSSEILNGISSAAHARALVHLWLNEPTFFDRVPVTLNMLAALKRQQTRVSQLCLQGLLDLFFNKFDRVTDIESFSNFLIQQIESSNLNNGLLSVLSRNAKSLLSINGPKWLVKQAKNSQIDLVNLLPRMGLQTYQNSRFIEIANNHYYLEQLKEVEPEDANNSILNEIIRKDVYESPYSKHEFLGHKILEILIDRVSGNNIPEHWQSIVLSIAGDPRVPSSAAKYQRWWAILGDARIAKVRGWLSRFDLKLFLEALEQSAKDQHLNDMERMFESRKVFMEGLLAQGLINDSRLFLSKSAEFYLKKNYKKSELPEYAISSSKETSVIYLNVGGLHMVEGSHSFKLKIMDKLPIRMHGVNLLDYSKTRFDDYYFRESIKHGYLREYPGTFTFFDAAHDRHLNWQHKALEFMQKNGVRVRPEKVISKERYKEYKQKFGIS